MSFPPNTLPASMPSLIDAAPHHLRPAVFLDRDGVLIQDTDYVAGVHEVQIIPGAAVAVKRLNDAGWPVVVVTNQSGVARGYFTEQAVREVHEHLTQEFRKQAGAVLDRFEYCPHHPTKGIAEYVQDCLCRKPKTGMLQRATKELHLDLAKSWIVGDRITDLQAGAAAGCRTILVRTGYGIHTTLAIDGRWDELNLSAVVADVTEAVEWILTSK